MLKLVARREHDHESEDWSLYAADLDDISSVAFWFPKGTPPPTSMDIHVEFEEGESDDD